MASARRLDGFNVFEQGLSCIISNNNFHVQLRLRETTVPHIEMSLVVQGVTPLYMCMWAE